MVLSARIRRDLRFLHQELDHYNGYSKLPSKIGFVLKSAIEEGDIEIARMTSFMKAPAVY